jgi:hypothetical protein
MGNWEGFLQSSASASATLIGLVFVAISINLARILAYPHLPARAAAALAPLGAVLVVALLGLAPDQPRGFYGGETLVAGVIMGLSGVPIWIAYKPGRENVSRLRRWSSMLLHEAQSLPFVIAGVLMIAGRPEGLDWIVPGVVLSLLSGLTNTWVLLVEIVR